MSTSTIATKRALCASYLIRVVVVLLAALIMSVGVANAQDEEESTGDRAYAECISRQYDESAVQQLLEDGVIEYPEDGNVTHSPASDSDWVAEMKEEHPEEFARLHDHYENDQSLGSQAGRVTNSATCHVLKPVDTAVKTVQESEFWDGPLGSFVDALISGNTQALQQVMTLWLDFTIGGEEIEGIASGVTYTVWALAFTVFVISLIVVGAKMAALRRQGLADGMEELGSLYGRFLIIGVAVPMIVPPAIVAFDLITDQILTLMPQGESLEDAIGESIPAKDIFEPALLLLPMLFTLAGTVTQMVALAARVLILPILVGLLPVAAAGSGTETGRMSVKSMMTWICAAIAFKPLAALLYVVAFNIASGDSIDGADGTIGTIFSLLILGIAGFSPLMVLKIVSPMFANTSGQNSAATAGAAMAGVGGAAGLALGGGAAAAGAAGKALGGGTGGGSGGSAGKGGSGSPGTGGSPTPPSGGGGQTGGGDSPGAQPTGGGSGGSGGSGGTGGGSNAQPTGGSPSASTGPGTGDKNAGSTSTQPQGGTGGGNNTPSRGRRAAQAAGSAARNTARTAGSTLQRTAGGLKVAQRVAQRGADSAGRGASHAGRMMDDIGK